jgi:hypothetical protein
METIHIFDEFKHSACDTTLELRHQKRMALEPLVFDILKEKYGRFLREHFETAKIPTTSENCILIIERRIHPNLEFLLHNAVYFAPGWSICFICSDVNLAYCQEISQSQKSNISFLPIFTGSPPREQARNEYSEVLKSTEFYERLPWKNVWICQIDSYFRRKIPTEVLEYEFFSAPASWEEELHCGGMSFRNRDAMIRLTKEFKEDIFSEDVYFSRGARALGLKVPPFETAVTYIVESSLYEDPIGVHQWWTFFSFDIEVPEFIFTQLLHFVMT